MGKVLHKVEASKSGKGFIPYTISILHTVNVQMSEFGQHFLRCSDDFDQRVKCFNPSWQQVVGLHAHKQPFLALISFCECSGQLIMT